MKKILIFCFVFISSYSFSDQFDFLAHYEGKCNGVEIAGNLIYYSSGPTIHMLNIADPENIVEINSFYTGNIYPQSLLYSNGFLYISAATNEVIYDVSDPMQPEFVSVMQWPFFQYAHESLVSGSLLLIDQGNNQKIAVIDIGTIYNPQLCSTIEFNINGLNAYAVENDILYGFEYYNENYKRIIAYDLSDPYNPSVVAEQILSNSEPGVYMSDMLIYKKYLLATIGEELLIYDIEQPDTIPLVLSYNLPFETNNLDISGDTLAIYNKNAGLLTLKLSDPANPVAIGFYNQIDHDIVDFRISGNMLATSKGYSGFDIKGIVDNSTIDNFYSDFYTDGVSSMATHDNFVYIGTAARGIQVSDLSDLTSIEYLGVEPSLTWIRKIEYAKGFLFCTDNENYELIYIVDVNNPINPQLVNQISVEELVSDFEIQGDTLFALAGGQFLKFYDISEPANPVEIFSVNQSAHRIAVDGKLIVLAGKYQGNQGISSIRTLTIGNNWLLSKDELILGSTMDYNPRDLRIDPPYIHIAVTTGVVVIEMNENKEMTLADEIIYGGSFTYVSSMNSNDNYVYLGIHVYGNDELQIIDISNPYDINVVKSISAYCWDIDFYQDKFITSNVNAGFRVFGDLITAIPNSEIQSENELFSLFPNPVSDYTNITFKQDVDESAILRILSSEGKELMRYQVSGGKNIRIDTQYLKPGTYYCYLHAISGNFFKKFLIVR